MWNKQIETDSKREREREIIIIIWMNIALTTVKTFLTALCFTKKNREKEEIHTIYTYCYPLARSNFL